MLVKWSVWILRVEISVPRRRRAWLSRGWENWMHAIRGRAPVVPSPDASLGTGFRFHIPRRLRHVTVCYPRDVTCSAGCYSSLSLCWTRKFGESQFNGREDPLCLVPLTRSAERCAAEAIKASGTRVKMKSLNHI